MKHVKYRVFFEWEFEKEEEWLNKMADDGYKLLKVGVCRYVFEDASKGEYIYRLELLSMKNTKTYIEFLKETGVEHIGTLLMWGYFAKKRSDGPFEIYSDVESKIKHEKRTISLLYALLPPIMLAISINLTNYVVWEHNYLGLGTATLCIILLVLLVRGIFIRYKLLKKLKAEKNIIE